ASGDDGFEFFGGTVNTKYLISAFNNDDSFDWDEGFRGKGQFWFAIQDTDNAGRVAEMDGSSVSSEDTNPYAFPVISNATYIGPGSSNIPAGDGSGEFMLFRDNTGGEYHNSIFTAHSAIAVEVEEKGTEVDSESRLAADSLNIKNSIFFDFGAGTDFASISSAPFVATELGLTANVNTISDPLIRSIDRTASTFGLDPRFNEGSPASSGAVIPDDEFFTEVTYKGAFGVKNWMVGWTGLDALGFINQGIVTNNEEEVTTVPSSVVLEQNYPNPFNPSTQISFQLPSAQKVTLKVYDMLGREVATLLNNEQYSSGSSSVTFDATNLSSGIYLYRLTGADFTKTQRMTLIK
ncbi:T9SS type A sorting domain-containing protein, partial [Balneola sp. EhC07]|uniref:T9SS type A sorting domain-containing protein n=1 Tax=Balneola sp. EhC07 TaxID=1849360 RepID=UPI000A692288